MNQHPARGTRTAVLVVLLGAVVALGGRIALAQESDAAVNWWVIGGGGGPSGGTGVMTNDTAVSFNDTLGQPVIGPSSGGDGVGLSAGYWTGGCAAAAAVMPVVTAAISEIDPADVVLTWDAAPANVLYQVWVTTEPYFDPDHPGDWAPEVIPDLTYTDHGASASSGNHYYVVRGLNACGAVSANSARTGEFTIVLMPGG